MGGRGGGHCRAKTRRPTGPAGLESDSFWPLRTPFVFFCFFFSSRWWCGGGRVSRSEMKAKPRVTDHNSQEAPGPARPQAPPPRWLPPPSPPLPPPRRVRSRSVSFSPPTLPDQPSTLRLGNSGGRAYPRKVVQTSQIDFKERLELDPKVGKKKFLFEEIRQAKARKQAKAGQRVHPEHRQYRTEKPGLDRGGAIGALVEGWVLDDRMTET